MSANGVSIERNATHVNVLLAKLLVQALAQGPQRMLASGEDAGSVIPADARRRAGEDERAALTLRVDLVLLELFDDLVREPKCAVDVRVDNDLDVLLADVEEGLPHAGTGVIECNAYLRAPARGPGVRPDGVEHVGECLEAVRLNWEGGDLVGYQPTMGQTSSSSSRSSRALSRTITICQQMYKY